MTPREKFMFSLGTSLTGSIIMLVTLLLLFAPFNTLPGIVTFFAFMSAHLVGNAIISIFMYDEKLSWEKNATRLMLWEVLLLPRAIRGA